MRPIGIIIIFSMMNQIIGKNNKINESNQMKTDAMTYSN